MIRKILDESLLHHIIMETINDYLNEDGAMEIKTAAMKPR